MADPTKSDGKPEEQQRAFDEFAHLMLCIQAGHFRTARILSFGLNSRAALPEWDPSGMMGRRLGIAEARARMVLQDPETTVEQKWDHQRAAHEEYMAWSRNGSLYRKYVFPSAKLANDMASDGYVGMNGYADPRFQEEAEISANFMRVLGLGDKVLRAQVLGFTKVLLARAPGSHAGVAVDQAGHFYATGGIERAA